MDPLNFGLLVLNISTTTSSMMAESIKVFSDRLKELLSLVFALMLLEMPILVEPTLSSTNGLRINVKELITNTHMVSLELSIGLIIKSIPVEKTERSASLMTRLLKLCKNSNSIPW
jgi:hypothetical protein